LGDAIHRMRQVRRGPAHCDGHDVGHTGGARSGKEHGRVHGGKEGIRGADLGQMTDRTADTQRSMCEGAVGRTGSATVAGTAANRRTPANGLGQQLGQRGPGNVYMRQAAQTP
jgi:hypothetical protein